MRRLAAVCLLVWGLARVCRGEEKETYLGVLRSGERRIALREGLIYESQGEKGLETVVMLSETPLDRGLLMKSLKRDGTDGIFFQTMTRVKLRFDGAGKFLGCRYIVVDEDQRGSMTLSVGNDETGQVVANLTRVGGRATGSAVYEVVDPETKKKIPNAGFELAFGGEIIRIPAEAEENIKRAAMVPVPPGKVTGRLKVRPTDVDKVFEMKMAHVVIYESIPWGSNDVVVNVLMSEEPIPLRELRNSLAAKGGDEGFYCPVGKIHLRFTRDGTPAGCHVSVSGQGWGWSGGGSLRDQKLKLKVEVKDGKVKGTATYDDAAPDPKMSADMQKFLQEGKVMEWQFDVAFEGTMLVVPEMAEHKRVVEQKKREIAAREEAPQGTVAGSMTFKKKHLLTHGVAYETKDSDDEACTCVVLSVKRVPFEKHLPQLTDEKAPESFLLSEPFLKLYFHKEGEAYRADLTIPSHVSTHQGGFTGRMEIREGRVKGEAKLESVSQFNKDRFEVTFDVELLTDPKRMKEMNELFKKGK